MKWNNIWKKYPILNIHCSPHSSETELPQSEIGSTRAIESKILNHPADKDSDLAIAFKVASEGFRGQLPHWPETERERENGIGSSTWKQIPLTSVAAYASFYIRAVEDVRIPFKSTSFLRSGISRRPSRPNTSAGRCLQCRQEDNVILAPLNA